MPEQPERFDTVTAAEVASAFVVAAREHGLTVTPELVATLLAQSALETGNWQWLRNYNFGHFKATDAWVAGGGDYVFFVKSPPHFRAPVSENMTAAQIVQARSQSQRRTDGVDGPDMQVLGEAWPGVRTVAFWASHPQTRFRAFATAEEGAKAYVGKFLGRYRGALEPASRGDVRAYVTALRDLGPYFTADFTQYYLGVLDRYRAYLPAARVAVDDEIETVMLPNTGAFRTDPADVEIREEGWIRLSTGVEVTRLPLWDRRHDLAARIGFGPAAELLKTRGMRLPTTAELDELHQLSHHVDPVTKVHREGDQHFMMSHRWCAEHDAEVWRKLRESGWDGSAPVVNFGKHWVQPAGTIYGWWTEPPPGVRKIQGPSDWHRGEPTYSDYATNVIAARDPSSSRGAELGDLAVAMDPDATPLELARAYVAPREFRLGLRLCHWLGYQLGIDPREIIGPEHDPVILSYSEHARRGGTFLGVDEDHAPIWRGGYSVKAPSDEWAWCAFGRSEGLRMCLLPGETPPHGLRAAVHELVSDARAAGRLRLAGSGYEPKPGDAAISGRSGQSPLRGGLGHVDTLIQALEPNLGAFIGGNEDGNTEHGGRWRRDEVSSFDHIEAWIDT